MINYLKSPSNGIVEHYSSYMNLGEGYIVDLILATRLSLESDNPLWLCIQGASSSGKTDILRMLKNDSDCHFLYDLTGVSLFSGANGAGGGYIPREVGDEGILVFPDFTTTLTKGKYTLDSIMSQLRVTYDGDANRITGMDTQRREPWNGKVGVLLAVTDEIERFKKKASGLGERFLYFRHTIPEFDTLGFKSKTPNKFPKEEYDELLDIGRKLDPLDWTDEMRLRVNNAAKWVSMARSSVVRDSRTKEVELVNSPEEPYRLVEQFHVLINSLYRVHMDTIYRTWSIFNEIVWGCVPFDRFDLLISILKEMEKTDPNIKGIRQSELTDILSYGKSRLSYLVEDMCLQGIITKEDGNIFLTEEFGTLWDGWTGKELVFSKY